LTPYCDPNASCAFNGATTTCTCKPGFTRPDLGCSCSESACPTNITGLNCSGHGSCLCGECDCDPGWRVADDCSCSQESCPSDNGAECSGHGTCVCGVCQCDFGYGTESCGCSLKECDPFCYERNLTCECGKCQCPPDLGGPTCEDCLNCIVDVCGPHPDCASCINDALCVWCPSTGVCTDVNAATCTDKATYADGCPTPSLTKDQAIALGFGLLALVMCIGIILIAILKGIQKVRELKEFQEWEAEQKRAKWDNNANPLFNKQEKEGNSALYQGK